MPRPDTRVPTSAKRFQALRIGGPLSQTGSLVAVAAESSTDKQVSTFNDWPRSDRHLSEKDMGTGMSRRWRKLKGSPGETHPSGACSCRDSLSSSALSSARPMISLSVCLDFFLELVPMDGSGDLAISCRRRLKWWLHLNLRSSTSTVVECRPWSSNT